MKIKTDYWLKPIPMRNFDWTAVDDDRYDGTGPVGCGRTRDEAIEDLLEKIEWQYGRDLTDAEYAEIEEARQRKDDAREGFE